MSERGTRTPHAPKDGRLGDRFSFSGVKEGEVIIIDGMHKVRPGAKVNPVYSVQN